LVHFGILFPDLYLLGVNIPRHAAPRLARLATQFKAVAVVGPRQSGKTTLLKSQFPDHPYHNLENPDTRRFALEDPRGFLHQCRDGAILDEVQRTPELFSYLQQVLDDSPEPGRVLLSGANNFLLQETVSQSLAGRVAYQELLPFDLEELRGAGQLADTADEAMLQGGYPPLFSQPVGRGDWFGNYIRTYVERDVRMLRGIGNLVTFERFVRLCAGRVGQLLNQSALAAEAGVDAKTAAAWLSVLESSFVVFRLPPHHQNFNKRLVKMPKLYFVDTGLAAHLLGIRDEDTLRWSPFRGALFENLIVTQMRTRRLHSGVAGGMFFWRDHKGLEVDVLLEEHGTLVPWEIKSGATVAPDMMHGLRRWRKLAGIGSRAFLVHGGDARETRSDGMEVLPWRDALHAD